MTKLLKGSLLALFAVALVLISADISNAQPRRARGKVYTKAEVDRIIKRLEENLDKFVDAYDKSLDKSRLDGSEREDELMSKARLLESATDELRREFDRRDTWQENKNEVRKCVDHAKAINTSIKNRRLGGKTESTWAKVRYEINTLAKLYNVPGI